EYGIEHAEGRFYIRTNWQAKDFRLMSVEPGRTTDRNVWREEVPLRPGVFLRDFDDFSKHLVVSERSGGLSQLQVIPWAHRDAAHTSTFDEPVFVVDLDVNRELETPTLRFAYSSLTTPPSVYDYDMESRSRTLMKQQEVLGG